MLYYGPQAGPGQKNKL